VTILSIGPAAGAILHVKHQGLQIGGGATGDTAAPAGRDPLSRSSLTSLALARLRHDREYLTCRGDTVAEQRQSVVAGELAVRWERQGAMLIMWLTGALDQATVTLLDRELDGQAIGLMGLVVDLTGLVFIDSPGLDALVGIHWRASKRGDRLSFRHGPHVAQRPVELTRTVRLRSRSAARTAGMSDEDFYFALAMACVDVDHPWSGDRPEAA
jgi:anti-anti-sigma factor